MKVVVVHNRYGITARGGAEAVAAAQVAELRHAGHEVLVVTCADHASGFTALDSSVWTYSPPNLTSFLSLGNLAYPLRFLWHLIDTLSPLPVADWQDWLSSQKPDLVITHNLKGLGLASVRVFSNGQWEHICHDVQLLLPSGLMMYGKESSLDSLHNKIYQAVCRKLFSRVKKVSFHSQWLLDLHKSRGFFPNAELVKIGPALVVPEPRPRKPGEPLKVMLGGQLEPHKGTDWLVENWPKVRDALGNATLTIPGAGSSRARLQALTASDPTIIWMDYLNPADFASLLKTQDVLVVPSQCYENAPTVIAQAYAVGLPVVASRCGGIPEMVPADRTFEPGSVSSLIPLLRVVV